MATREYKSITDNLNKYLNQDNAKETAHNSIIGNIIINLEKSKKYLDELFVISNTDDFSKKQEYLNEFMQRCKVDLELMEYLISDFDTDIVEKDKNFRILRHNYYSIKNIILDIKNDIVSTKIDKYNSDFNKADNKLSNLESKFEGLGATVITIILSITIISAAVTGISNMPSTYIPVFIFSMVWLGMTFLIFVNNLFNKNDFNSKQATIMYLIISIIFVIILFVTIHLTLPN